MFLSGFPGLVSSKRPVWLSGNLGSSEDSPFWTPGGFVMLHPFFFRATADVRKPALCFLSPWVWDEPRLFENSHYFLALSVITDLGMNAQSIKWIQSIKRMT